MTDEQLVELIRQGEEDAYRVLIERHRAYIYTLVYKMVDHRETAEDITQEVFIKLYRSLHLFRGDSKLTTWLYRLAVNRVTDYRRSRGRKPMESLLDKVKGWFSDARQQPEKAAVHNEQRRSVQQIVAALPDKYRLVIYLYHYRQLSYQEISDITGLPVKTVETRLYRGKSMLRQKWLEVNVDELASSERAAAASFFE